MKFIIKYLGSVVLAGTLLVPAAAMAQDRDHPRDEQHRYYDRDHKDYHQWSDQEEHAYREWMREHHRNYRDYAKLNQKQQREYWNWRHDHPEQFR